jgi:putative membrane protein
MRIFLSIVANGLILFAIQYFLPEVVAEGGWKLYFVGGVVLGLLNTFVKPILKIFGFPLIVLTLGLFSIVINGVILALLEKIIALLNIAGVAFSTGSFVNFAISVVIFTLFNTLYSAFFK